MISCPMRKTSEYIIGQGSFGRSFKYTPLSEPSSLIKSWGPRRVKVAWRGER